MVLDIIETALQEVSFRKLVNNVTHVTRDELMVENFSYDLGQVDDIYVVGAGKQVTFVASALEDILGDRIREGLVIEKKGWGCSTKRIKTVKGGHPLPDKEGVQAAVEIVKIAEKASKNDLVIACVTGGCTSLAMLPPESVPLADAQRVSELLLMSGAPIEDMNAVRKHLSQLGGGKLAVLSHPAQVVGLIALDEVQGLPWGPTVPDTTTFNDAITVLRNYELWDRIPTSVTNYLKQTNSQHETPKTEDFERLNLKCDNVIFAENSLLCKAVASKAAEMKLNTAILSTKLEGEAKSVGTILGAIALEIEEYDRPFKAPCVIIAGGETTVTIGNERTGEGGRNQELALSASLKIAGSKRTTIASFATDGSDGPTEIAGAIADGYTATQAESAKLDIFEHLKKHNSSRVFRTVGNAIYTNDTETNLMDIMIVVVS